MFQRLVTYVSVTAEAVDIQRVRRGCLAAVGSNLYDLASQPQRGINRGNNLRGIL